MLPHGFERCRQFLNIVRQKRFAAGNNDMPTRILFYRTDNFGNAPRCSLRPPGGVGRIAPGAAQIATRGSNENRGDTHETAFALNGVKDFADAHRVNLAKP